MVVTARSDGATCRPVVVARPWPWARESSPHSQSAAALSARRENTGADGRNALSSASGGVLISSTMTVMTIANTPSRAKPPAYSSNGAFIRKSTEDCGL